MPSRRTVGNPRIAVAYLRASTDEQHLSPDVQRAAIEAWATHEGVVVAAWHVDASVSGAAEIDGRPGLVAALGELRAVGAGVLVVSRRDRLARDVGVAATIERAASASGAHVVSADGVANGDTPADKFLRTILDAAAEYERALIRARTRGALAAKRARGERAGTVPYGFTADAAGRLSPCAAEQEVIRQVKALRAAGLSFRAINAELARVGLVGRTGNMIGLEQLTKIASMEAAA